MPFPVFLSLVSACLVIALTPGAGAVNTMSTSLRVGWTRTFWTIVGLEAALLVQLLIVAVGIGSLVQHFPALLLIIRILGALYLLYLGVKLLLEKPHLDEDGVPAALLRMSRMQMIARGFTVNITNPKAILFLVAFVPNFVDPSGNQLVQYAIVAAVMVAVDVLVMWGLFASLASTLSRLTHSPAGLRRLNIIFGLLFIGMAALVAFMPAH